MALSGVKPSAAQISALINTQLAALLASGLSLSEAAEKLEFTENTVRSYCKTILSKTGVGRQADLVRLVLRSVAVLG